METLNFIVIVFGPAICLMIGYIYGRFDEAKEQKKHGRCTWQ